MTGFQRTIRVGLIGAFVLMVGASALRASAALPPFIERYFGFRLGEANLNEIRAQLQADNIAFEETKIDSEGTPRVSLRLKATDRFAEYGEASAAVLRFAPNQVLYRIEVVYRDADVAFSMIKKDLLRGGSVVEDKHEGESRRLVYRDGEVEAVLTAKAEEGTTELAYVYLPLQRLVDGKRFDSVILTPGDDGGQR